MKNINIISRKDVKDLSKSNKQIKDNKASVSASENHCHLFIGPSNVGRLNYMLKKPEKVTNKRHFHILTRSPI